MKGPLQGVLLSAVLGAGVLSAAQDRISNARLETRSASQGLVRAVRDVTERQSAVWIGYQVPMLRDTGRRFCEGRPAQAFLEPPPTFTVLARAENNAIVRVRTFTPECEIDAGNMPVVWLSDVKVNDSAGWLATLVASQSDSPRRDTIVTPAITAIAMHDSPAAVQELINLARTAKTSDVRRESMNWLGRSKDPQALAFLKDLLTK